MQLYTIARDGNGWHWRQQLTFDGITLLVAMVLVGLLAGFGDSGVTAAFIAAPLITIALFWRMLRTDRSKAIAEHGRYYCGACWQHFEGDALRQITQ